jgi:hypothetical protein
MKAISELRKYLARFGLILLFVTPLLLIIAHGEDLRRISYKSCLPLIGLALGELAWAFFFKPVFGKVEDLKSYDQRNILIFRGILDAAVVLGLTLGL